MRDVVDFYAERERLRGVPAGPVSGGSGPVDNLDNTVYHNLIRSSYTELRTREALNQLNGASYGRLPAFSLELVAPDSEKGLEGTCFVTEVADSRQATMHTSSRFPDFLNQAGISDPYNLAAAYARSLEIVWSAANNSKGNMFSGKGSSSRFDSTVDTVLWKPEMIGTQDITIFRAAGTIALKTVKKQLGTKPRSRLAPHIAGLFNPLPIHSVKNGASDGTFRELSDMIKWYVGKED